MWLPDILEKDKVKKHSITRYNISRYMTLSPVILEYNPSSNSKIRLCAAPARRDKISSHSINKQTNIPNIAKILLENRLLKRLR